MNYILINELTGKHVFDRRIIYVLGHLAGLYYSIKWSHLLPTNSFEMLNDFIKHVECFFLIWQKALCHSRRWHDKEPSIKDPPCYSPGRHSQMKICGTLHKVVHVSTRGKIVWIGCKTTNKLNQKQQRTVTHRNTYEITYQDSAITLHSKIHTACG